MAGRHHPSAVTVRKVVVRVMVMPRFALFAAIGLAPVALLLVFVAYVRARRFAARRSRRPGDPLRVAFVHPDLGLGGAERLVVDAAVSLKHRGHAVSITTAHHDVTRCFEETRDGTLLVHIAGSKVPRHLRGKLHIVCAIGRAIVGAMRVLLAEPECDAAFVDLVPAPVPLLRACGMPVLFYCHFPDKLLASGQAAGAHGAAASCATASDASAKARLKSLARLAYRLPFDLLEELCTGCASRVLVNSAFTASVYCGNFHLLRMAAGTIPDVLHPAIDLQRNRALAWPAAAATASLEHHRHTLKAGKGPSVAGGAAGVRPTTTLVSINRFERKKALELAVGALVALRAREPAAAAQLKLVLAGGWDGRLEEQVAYLAELEAMVAEGGLAETVEFRRNVSDEERRELLESCAAVVYTPSYEHFGIVPLEAMAAARPVVAVGLGGPCESVVHGQTGWLCEPTPAAFAAAFGEVLRLHSAGMLEGRGSAARLHVETNFGLARFGEKLEEHMASIVDGA